MKKAAILVLGLISIISTAHAGPTFKLDGSCLNAYESVTQDITYKINGHNDLEIKGNGYGSKKIKIFIHRNVMPYRAKQLVEELTGVEKGEYALVTMSCESKKDNIIRDYKVEINTDYSYDEDEE
jgi:hypothetical protein